VLPIRRSLVAGTILASLALSACGGGSAPASYRSDVLSLGNSPDVQFTIRAEVAGPGIKTAIRRGLTIPVVDVMLASHSGTSIAASGGAVNAEIEVHFGSQEFLDLRIIGNDLYATANPQALGRFNGLPGIRLDPGELAAIQVILSDKWYQISWPVLLASIPKTASFQPSDADLIVLRTVLNAIFKTILDTPHDAGSGGFIATGDVASLFDTIVPPIARLAHQTLGPVPIPGTFTMSINGSSSGTTNVTFTGSVPNDAGAELSLTLTSSVTHSSTDIQVPGGATVITPALIRDFEHAPGG
jgi:hypothetical protein